MARTEIRTVNGRQVGFNFETNSYYPVGDPQFDPNYEAKPKVEKAAEEKASEKEKAPVTAIPTITGVVIEAQSEGAFGPPIVEYSAPPSGQPELRYQWLEGTAPAYVETEIEGATGPTYTPDKTGKFIRVRVTAVSGAAGEVISNAKKAG